MRPRLDRTLLVLASALAVVIAWGWWQSAAPAPQAESKPIPSTATDSTEPAKSTVAEPVRPTPEPRYARAYLVAEKLLARLKTPLALEKARPNEALLTFKDAEAYGRFLGRAAAAGLRVLGRMDGMHTVRIGYDSLDALAADIAAHPGDYSDVDANFMVYAPDVPQVEPRVAGRFVPIGNNLLSFLGVDGDTSKWGTGVTIAVLDSGVASDPTFGNGRVRYLDIGYGIAPTADNGHGTSVASLAGGMSSDAMGIAPSASLLSIRVTGADGLSDSFALSQGIMAAVDAGAQIVNVSMGSYSNNQAMNNAIIYATNRGVVVVASAGNDQANQLTWPAADARVVSVGAVDAAEQQVIFSNSGDQLKMTAPGFGLQTAWVNGQRVYVDGTSGSAPIVSGGIAAMMSQNPGLTASQAASLLQQYSSDGGMPGHDPNFGNGIINLGWAMNRNNFSRVDTAVSSQFFNSTNFQMEFLVQNRSAQTVNGMTLNVSAGGGERNFAVPALAAGGTYAVQVPVDYFTLQSNGRIEYRTQLINPPGIIDAQPGNNQRANSISLQK
jgi:hypothetical protein